MESIQLTPNFERMFQQMIAEAKRQADMNRLFDELSYREQATALRALQQFFAPLTIAANCATTVVAIEELRGLMTDVLAAINLRAAQLENDLAEDEADQISIGVTVDNAEPER